MYQQHFGFSEPPFSISPDPRFLYMSERHREALAHLVYGAGENGGFVLLTGQVGTGKTTLIRSLFQQTIDDVDFALCLYSGFSETEFLSLILDELGVSYPEGCGRKDLVYALNLHALKVHAEGRKIVIVIDEAQNLSRDLLEQIRLLTNLETNTQKLLRIILVGQEELQDLLADNSLRQLSQRITTRYHLTALSPSEVDEYIAYRLQVAGGSPLIIPKAVRRRVYQLSKGTPRLVNVICERALLGAYADDRNQLTARDVERAAARALPQTKKKATSGDLHHASQWHLRYLLLSLAMVAATIVFLRTDVSKRLLTALFHEPTTVETSTQIIPSSALEGTTSQTSSADADDTDALQAQKQAALAALQADQTEQADQGEQADTASSSSNRSERNGSNDNALSENKQSVESDTSANEPKNSKETEESTSNATRIDAVVQNSGLEEVYKDDLSRAALAQELATMWGMGNQLSLDKSYCDALSEVRLVCVERQASVGLLKQINRPALLEVSPSPSSGKDRWVLLTGMSDGRVFIRTANGSHEIGLDALANDYTGKAFFILRQPNTRFAAKPGQQGRQVAWLHERLQFYRNEPISPQNQRLEYSTALREDVSAFQREHNLDVDGVVGEETLLYLYNLVATQGTPTLD